MDIRERKRENKTENCRPRDLDPSKKKEHEELQTPNFVSPFAHQIIFKKKNKIRCKTVNVELKVHKKTPRLSARQVDEKGKCDYHAPSIRRQRNSQQALECALQRTKKYQDALNQIQIGE